METESSSYSKRSFFGLGKKKKKTIDKSKSSPSSPPKEVISPKLEPEPESEEEELEPLTLTTIPISATAPQLPLFASMSPITTSPTNAFAKYTSPASPIHSFSSGSSPAHAYCADTSGVATPRLSTSSSQIFERNVQEQLSGTNPPPPTSHTTPAHIQTENHIPAVLEASSIAITDSKCGVDEVEIVMHSMHQPAVSVVVPHTSSPLYEAHSHSHSSGHTLDESTGNSGDDPSSHSTTAADKRRLSFISFADVVQAELAEHDSSINLTTPDVVPTDCEPGLSTINETVRRSPSPIRLGSSPPRHCAGSVQGSLSGRPAGVVPPSLGDSLGMERGELTIETMRQALRKTGSGDLSGYARGPPKHGTGALRKDGWEF